MTIYFLIYFITTIQLVYTATPVQFFLLKHLDFYKSIPYSKDRHDFLLNVEARLYNSPVTLPAIFKAFKPNGYWDTGHLNSQALIYLSNCIETDADWREYSQNLDPIDLFALKCLEDTVFNIQVWRALCQLKRLSRSQLPDYFRQFSNGNLVDKYLLYDLFAQIADLFVSLFFTLILQVLCLYFSIISEPFAYLDDPMQVTAFLVVNLLISRFFYNNFLYY